MYYLVVVSAHYLHAVDQLSGKEQVQSHVLPKGVKSDRDQNFFFQSSQICKLLKEFKPGTFLLPLPLMYVLYHLGIKSLM